ncbi:phosphatase PAP2 family protein [Streptomyces sp. 7N604]|uniref:phosphatase PAP2 family protein n=1 Tax=Streptomyces sp. 7N604 TaxID=3457415 RepID=UPI003FD41F09
MDDTELYRDITDFAQDTPSWFHSLTEFGTEAGLLLLAAVSVAVWWRSRRGHAREVALALLGPLASAVAYVCSELAKAAFAEERPCRAVAGAARPLAACPPPGDWSFPSNHATIAAALAVGAVIAYRRAWLLVVPAAVLTACSRVVLGVHYPHDVAAGFALGALVVTVTARLLVRPATGAVVRLRTGPLRPLFARDA